MDHTIIISHILFCSPNLSWRVLGNYPPITLALSDSKPPLSHGEKKNDRVSLLGQDSQLLTNCHAAWIAPFRSRAALPSSHSAADNSTCHGTAQGAAARVKSFFSSSHLINPEGRETEMHNENRRASQQDLHLQNPNLKLDTKQQHEIQQKQMSGAVPGMEQCQTQVQMGEEWLRSSSAARELGVLLTVGSVWASSIPGSKSHFGVH